MNRAEQAGIEAADWLIAQADGPLAPDEQARFEAWLAESDGNKAAYWRLEFGWEQADRVAALGRLRADDIVAPGRSRRPRWWIPAAIAASVVLAIGIQQFVVRDRAQRAAQVELAVDSYATAVGETRLVDLADGSKIQLNTGSSLRSRISDARREVWLEQGEAFFDVAPDRNRPFVVHAGERSVTVLGTRFSVRRAGPRVVVAVLEGRVELSESAGGRTLRSSIISGGDIAMAAGSSTLVTSRSERAVLEALSWREGLLTFDQQPLSAIAEEFNRYNQRKIVLEDPSAASIRISGTFPADKPDAFARLLHEAYGLGFEESRGEIRVRP